jgi:hypothetical protein
MAADTPVPTSTLPVIPSPTMITRNTATPVATLPGQSTHTPVPQPSQDPNVPILPPASINTQHGITKGSLASLAVLQLTGMEDNPGEYVAFVPQKGKYSGYLSFSIPANIQTASLSSLSLHVNFKSSSPSRQTWVWSIYDWNVEQWVKVGSVTARDKDAWKMWKFDIRMLQQYASSGEIRIQLNSSKGNGEARLDYAILQLAAVSAAAPKSVTFVTETPAVSPTPTSVPSSSTPISLE